MFDLEKAIAEWRRQLSAEGINSPGVLDELEGHLRADWEQEMRSGAEADRALEAAIERIGPAVALNVEFHKLGMKHRYHELVLAAWVVYLVSFFLPAYMEGWGWQCAILQNVFWQGAMRGEWASIHYELLTLANLFMLFSPIILYRWGGSDSASPWLRYSTLAVSVLVWSFIALLFSHADRSALRIGCFAWASSFVLLHLSTWRRPEGRKQYV